MKEYRFENLAIIVGNGESRKTFPLETYNGIGKIYGCNAFYRDRGPEYDLPDFLVAIDDGMIDEINASNYPKEKLIIPPRDERWEPSDCNPHRPRSNAGINAVREAIKRGANVILMVGFDFMLNDRAKSTSNLFDGTDNYGPKTRAVFEDNIGRARYLDWVARKNKDVDFFLAYPDEYFSSDGQYKTLTTIPMTCNNVHMMDFSMITFNLTDDT